MQIIPAATLNADIVQPVSARSGSGYLSREPSGMSFGSIMAASAESYKPSQLEPAEVGEGGVEAFVVKKPAAKQEINYNAVFSGLAFRPEVTADIEIPLPDAEPIAIDSEADRQILMESAQVIQSITAILEGKAPDGDMEGLLQQLGNLLEKLEKPLELDDPELVQQLTARMPLNEAMVNAPAVPVTSAQAEIAPCPLENDSEITFDPAAAKTAAPQENAAQAIQEGAQTQVSATETATVQPSIRAFANLYSEILARLEQGSIEITGLEVDTEQKGADPFLAIPRQTQESTEVWTAQEPEPAEPSVLSYDAMSAAPAADAPAPDVQAPPPQTPPQIESPAPPKAEALPQTEPQIEPQVEPQMQAESQIGQQTEQVVEQMPTPAPPQSDTEIEPARQTFETPRQTNSVKSADRPEPVVLAPVGLAEKQQPETDTNTGGERSGSQREKDSLSYSETSSRVSGQSAADAAQAAIAFDVAPMRAEASLTQSAPAQAPVQTVQATPQTLFDTMVEQIAVTQQSVEIELRPEHLGKVSIELSLDQHGLQAKIRADDPGVKSVIGGQINQLIESLSEKGVRVNEVEVVYTGPQTENFEQGGQTPSGNSRRSRNLARSRAIKGIESAFELPQTADGSLPDSATVQYKA